MQTRPVVSVVRPGRASRHTDERTVNAAAPARASGIARACAAAHADLLRALAVALASAQCARLAAEAFLRPHWRVGNSTRDGDSDALKRPSGYSRPGMQVLELRRVAVASGATPPMSLPSIKLYVRERRSTRRRRGVRGCVPRHSCEIGSASLARTRWRALCLNCCRWH